MAQKKEVRDNVRQYRRPINLNVGMLLFVAVFIYLTIYVVVSLQEEHISPYEVREGSLAINYVYRALAIRDEEVVSAEKNGYINYFAREGERVATGDLVYTIDETGELREYLEEAGSDESTLSKEELIEMRSEIVNFVHGFDETDFSDVYDFKYTMKAEVLKLAGERITDSIDSINNAGMTNSVKFCNALNTGIVTYYTDGFEHITLQDVTMDMFDEEKYKKQQLLENELVTEGDVVYKLSKSEDWSLVIPIDENMAEDYLKAEYIKVRFLKNQYESWGQVFIINGADGNTYLQLLFNNSMITFAKDRYVDIELLMYDETGLKIPNTSIATEEFYLIPKKFVKVEDEKDTKGTILREAYMEDGTFTTSETEIELYSYNAETEEYYVDTSILSIGEDLICKDTQEKFDVSQKGSLVGVYYMNKGYADFRQIKILYQNDEYAIVESNTKYGLNVYDYIVLDASSVTDEQFIYK